MSTCQLTDIDILLEEVEVLHQILLNNKIELHSDHTNILAQRGFTENKGITLQVKTNGRNRGLFGGYWKRNIGFRECFEDAGWGFLFEANC